MAAQNPLFAKVNRLSRSLHADLQGEHLHERMIEGFGLPHGLFRLATLRLLPALDFHRHLARRGEPVRGPLGQGAEAHSLQRHGHVCPDLPWGDGQLLLHFPEDFLRVAAKERGPAGQDLVEDRAEAVDVGLDINLTEDAGGLLRRHVGGCSEGLPRHGQVGVTPFFQVAPGLAMVLLSGSD